MAHGTDNCLVAQVASQGLSQVRKQKQHGDPRIEKAGMSLKQME